RNRLERAEVGASRPCLRATAVTGSKVERIGRKVQRADAGRADRLAVSRPSSRHPHSPPGVRRLSRPFDSPVDRKKIPDIRTTPALLGTRAIFRCFLSEFQVECRQPCEVRHSNQEDGSLCNKRFAPTPPLV